MLEPKLQVHHFNDSSHIVLMKPQCTPKQESVKTQVPVAQEELSLRKLKAKVVSSKRLTEEKGPKFLKEVVRLNGKGINPYEHEKSSGKVKLYYHVSHTSQVNETMKNARYRPQAENCQKWISQSLEMWQEFKINEKSPPQN